MSCFIQLKKIVSRTIKTKTIKKNKMILKKYVKLALHVLYLR